ncbi:MAG: hypothetical protein AB1483_01345 [Candidatus Zixiibacteriota bacterium]
MNLPDYNFLSAPLWLVNVLHIVTLTLHLVAMNFLLGGVIILLFGKFNDRWSHPVVQKFIKLFPNIMAATVTIGVAPLLFAQLVLAKPVYAASIVSGWFWLMIFVVAIIAYYFMYAASFVTGRENKRVNVFLWITLVGLLYISFVYSSVFSLAERPELYASMYAGHQGGLIINPDLGSYIFRWLHMILGAITVGGFFVGLLGKDDEGAFKIGKTFYLWGMVAAMVIGLAYLFMFGEYILPFMRSTAAWALLIAIILSLGSLHFFFKKKFLAASLMLFLSMIAMVWIRHTVRLLFLDGKFDPASLPVSPQWSIFVIFLILFLVAVGLVWYMLKLFVSGKGQAA